MKAKAKRKTYVVRLRRAPVTQLCGPDLLELPQPVRDYILGLVGRGEMPERLRARSAHEHVTVKFKIVDALAG
jgi:hypothetical protein